MAGTKPGGAPSLGRCIVCSAKKKGSFFRAELCRACAVFFRRATKSTTPFVCRSSTGNCRIERERIYACAKCRFERIQKIMENLERCWKEAPRNELDRNCEPSSDSENYSKYLDEFLPTNISPSLRRFTRCYNDLCRQRLIIDFGSINDLPFNENGKIEAPATYEACAGPGTMRKVHEEIRAFLIAASEEFSVMRPEYQTLLLDNFMRQFIPFECFYRSVKNLAATNTNRFYASFGRYLDMENVANFYKDSFCDNDFKKKELKTLQEGARRNSKILAAAMERLGLSDEEFIGIMAMLLWNIGHNSESDELSKIAAAKKKAALHDLYLYYKSFGITNYASRLGEIFMFLSLVECMSNEFGTLIQRLRDFSKEELLTLLEEQNLDRPS